LFALAAVTGAAFWFLDGLMKGYQYAAGHAGQHLVVAGPA
jgi:hypothetical protein